jgi:hypothetical protein
MKPLRRHDATKKWLASISTLTICHIAIYDLCVERGARSRALDVLVTLADILIPRFTPSSGKGLVWWPQTFPQCGLDSHPGNRFYTTPRTRPAESCLACCPCVVLPQPRPSYLHFAHIDVPSDHFGTDWSLSPNSIGRIDIVYLRSHSAVDAWAICLPPIFGVLLPPLPTNPRGVNYGTSYATGSINHA